MKLYKSKKKKKKKLQILRGKTEVIKWKRRDKKWYNRNKKIRGTAPNSKIVHFTGNFENKEEDDVIKR